MAERESAFDCSICLHAFRNPKLLPCSHTFCAECLELYIEKSSAKKRFTCPLCRKYLEIPENGISEIPANYYILPTSEISLYNTSVTCDCCCGEDAGMFMCLQYNDNYCKSCMEYHGKLKATRDHEILEITQENGHSESRIRRKPFCSIHGEDTVFICDCNVQICLHCKATMHENHKVESIVVTAKQVREQIEEIMSSERRKLAGSLISSQKQMCCSMQHELDLLELREVTKIGKRAFELKIEIDEICTEQKRKVQTRVDEERQNIKENEKFANDRLQSMKLLCSTAQSIVKTANDIDIINLGRALCKNMEDSFTENSDTVIYLPHIEFKQGDLKSETIESTFGRVSIWSKPKHVSSMSLDQQYTIYGLCPMNDGTCWIANGTDILSVIDLTGQVMQTISGSSKLRSFATDTDGTTLVSSSTSIQKYSMQGTIVDVCSSIQFKPIAMAVDRVTDNLTVISTSSVYSMSRDGSMNEIKFHGTTFKKAFGIAADDAGTVCICDWGNRVVTFFDINRKIKSTYNGTDINKFSPHGVCCVDHGNYFVVDKLSKMIDVLRSDGSLEYCFSVKEHFNYQVCVAVNGCRLWVGFQKGLICIYDILH